MEKDIQGFEGLYKVTDLGTVISSKTGQKIFQATHMGYKRVSLYKDGKEFRIFVHRIVATSFIENLDNKRCVNHKDLDRINNKLSNLEWCTHKENTHHAIGMGVKIGRGGGIVGVIDKETAKNIKSLLKDGLRIIDIKRKLNVTYQTVSNIKYGVSHKDV